MFQYVQPERSYDVDVHANSRIFGDWLRYRFDGYCFYPMTVMPEERELDQGRFANFTRHPYPYWASITYTVLTEGDEFQQIVEWIHDTGAKWSFTIDAKPQWFERQCNFSFSDEKVAVAFALRWTS